MRSFNYAKKGCLYFIFTSLFVVLLAAGKLEATISALDGTVNSSRERIEHIIKTSRNIADGIERLEYLFKQYASEVNRLLNEVDAIRNKAEIQSKNNMDCGSNSGNIYNCAGHLANIKNKVRY